MIIYTTLLYDINNLSVSGRDIRAKLIFFQTKSLYFLFNVCQDEHSGNFVTGIYRVVDSPEFCYGTLYVCQNVQGIRLK